MPEPKDGDYLAAALSKPSASIVGVPALLFPLFDPAPYSTMTLEYSARTAISPSRPDELQCSRGLPLFEDIEYL